jgi:hypothetical protein
MKKIIISVILAIALTLVLLPATVFAATTGEVQATVTAGEISVTVSDGQVAYGTLDYSATKSTLSGELNDTQTAQAGTLAVDLNIKSSNALGGTQNWTLAGTAGADQFVHEFSTDSGTNWTAMTDSYQTLGDISTAGGTKNFDLQITMPSSSTDPTEKSITVTVQAVAYSP